jgi:hypothetical protein
MNSTKYIPFKYNILFSEIAKFARKKIRNNKKQYFLISFIVVRVSLFLYLSLSCSCARITIFIDFFLPIVSTFFFSFSLEKRRSSWITLIINE